MYILVTEPNPIFIKPLNPVFMKRRVRKIANFFAFNLLFFALYLNFIHKDKSPAAAFTNNNEQTTQSKAPFGESVLVETPKQGTSTPAVQQPKTEQGSTAALKLSIN